MIKLIDLLKEENNDRAAKLKAARAAATSVETNFSDEDIKKGFKTGPEGEVTYIPKIPVIKNQMAKYKKDLRPFKYDNDQKVATVSKEIYETFNYLDRLLSRLRDMVELKKIK
jgi:hypothetical protein